MDPTILFSKCITLLYRESQLETQTENSADLIRTTIEKVKTGNLTVGMGGGKDSATRMKELVMEMCNQPTGHTYDSIELLQQLKIITNGDDNLYRALEQGIKDELQPAVLKRTITNIRKSISNFFREQKTAAIISKANRDLNFNRHSISDLSEYIRNVIIELEATSAKATGKDSAIVKTMNFENDESMEDVFSSVISANSDELVFQTGWRELNQALQGGPRPGDCLISGALQHNYKTGSSLSLFAHIAMYNKPKCKDPAKKPLMYRVSFEDPLRNNAQFLYQLIKFDETRQPVSVDDVDIEEMWRYVQTNMRRTGYHIILEEVNPSNWTYQSFVNRIIELESEGYAVEVVACDYLAKLPTTGCVQGAIGDDYMDLLSRMRGFCSASGILFLSPWQLSTEAKRLLQTIPHDQFLNQIKGGGYFEKTKGLDRIYDIGVLLHIVPRGDDAFLHVVIDKHRFPRVAPASVKSFYLRFPKDGMPIPSNINDENYEVLRKIPRHISSESEDKFFSME